MKASKETIIKKKKKNASKERKWYMKKRNINRKEVLATIFLWMKNTTLKESGK